MMPGVVDRLDALEERQALLVIVANQIIARCNYLRTTNSIDDPLLDALVTAVEDFVPG